jgi:ribonuclease R
VRHLLKGERSGVQFRLGDHVRIQVLRASLEDRKIDFRLVSPRKEKASEPPRGERRYDYAAAGERYSLPHSRKGTERSATRDNAAPAVALPPLPPLERKAAPKASEKKAGGKGVFAKVKSAAKGKLIAVKDAATKATSKARKAGKKKGKR